MTPCFLRLLALLATMTFASHARAVDTASVEVLGFSADGRLFAFEEYGVQDGSGFPYSNRYYIETATDKFVAGTPVRVMIEDEEAPLEDARARAKARGQSIVGDAELARNRGFLAGFNSVSELSADPFRMVVNPRAEHMLAEDPVEFRIEEIPLMAPRDCVDQDAIVGLRVLRVYGTPGGRTELRHEDRQVPSSRGCTLGYRIGGIQTFHSLSGAAVYALLVAVRRVGFEGSDYRWIALTGRL